MKHGNRFRHGMCNTTEYSCWMHILARCENPKDPAYHNYGARGIRVCARWHDFVLFFKDMGKRPKGLTLERKNNDGHYEPGNCIWTDRTDQAYNRRPYKLTRKQVEKIRQLVASGLTQREVATRFRVNASHISRIVHHKARMRG